MNRKIKEKYEKYMKSERAYIHLERRLWGERKKNVIENINAGIYENVYTEHFHHINNTCFGLHVYGVKKENEKSLLGRFVCSTWIHFAKRNENRVKNHFLHTAKSATRKSLLQSHMKLAFNESLWRRWWYLWCWVITKK